MLPGKIGWKGSFDGWHNRRALDRHTRQTVLGGRENQQGIDLAQNKIHCLQPAPAAGKRNQGHGQSNLPKIQRIHEPEDI